MPEEAPILKRNPDADHRKATTSSLKARMSGAWRNSRHPQPDTPTQSLIPSRPFIAMSVEVSRAISFSCPPVIANTSAWAKVRVRPVFFHAPAGKDALACGGSEKIDLELCGENPGVGAHQTKRSIARRTVGDGAHSSAMYEAVLLRYCPMRT
jgi:hypothetical protein